MGSYRVLITSDIHCTDLEDWYGVSDRDRMEHWLREVLAEHEKEPFDLILVPGDISLDYHQELTPFQKGYSTAYLFMKMYASRLPEGVPVLVGAGNHEQFPEEAWRKITGCSRQSHHVLGEHLFILLDSFKAALGTEYDSSDAYTPMDTDYVRGLMEAHPDKYVWLLSHWFEPGEETEAFRQLVRDPRVKGLFMGHSHDHRLIALGPEWGNKVIAQTGNFSYTMSGAHTGGFWGFRDLKLREDRAVSSYIMVESTVILEEGTVTFPRRISEVAEYEL